MNKPEGGRFARNSAQGNANSNLKKINDTPRSVKDKQEFGHTIPTIASLLPSSISGLGKSVIYQDFDHVSNQSSSKEIPVKSPANTKRSDQSKGVENKLTASSKFARMPPVDNTALTPNKNANSKSSQEIQVDSFQTASGKLTRNQESKKEGRNTPLNKDKQKGEFDFGRNIEGDGDGDRSITEGEATGRSITEASNKKIQRKQERNRDVKFVVEKSQTDGKPMVTDTKSQKKNTQDNSDKTLIQVPKIEETTTSPTPLQSEKPKKYQPRGRAISQNPPIRSQIFPKKQVAQVEVLKKIQPDVKSETKIKPAIQPRLIPKKQQPTEIKQTESITSQSVVTTPINLSESRGSDSRIKPISRRSPVNKTETDQQQIKIPLSIAPVKIKTQPVDINPIDQSQIKPQPQKITLKKTSVVLVTIKRLVRSKLEDGFRSLNVNRRNNKILTVNECCLLCYAMDHTVKNKESCLIKAFFSNIKRHVISTYAIENKQLVQSIPATYKSSAVTLLDKLYKSKIREVMITLFVRKENINKKVHIFGLVQRLVKRKSLQRLVSGLDKIRQYSLYKKDLLNKLALISQKVNMNKLLTPFSKLVLNKNKEKQVIEPSSTKKIQKIKPKQEPAQLQQADNQALIDKLTLLKTNNASVTQEIASLQSKLKDKRKQNDNQKSSRSQKLTLLKQQNEHTKIQIEIKRHRTQEIKSAIEAVDLKPEQEVLLEGDNQMRESKLELLTNLYISNYKNPEETLKVDDLRSSFDLQEEDSNTVLREWRSINQNTELKRIMASYEDSDPKLYKARTTLIEQQFLVSKLIKSYLKQQYFWEWIHLSAHSS